MGVLEQPTRDNEEAQESRLSSGPRKILLVEDCCVNQVLLEERLKRGNLQVLIAANGEEAVDLFRTEHPDIVIMDVLMPVMDGYEATRRIKALAGDAFVPVIFLTHVVDEPALVKCIEAGGDDVLPKDYSDVLLRTKIRRFLRMRDLYEEHRRQREELAYHAYERDQEYKIAERILSSISRPEYLKVANVKHVSWPMEIFNGDILLAVPKPAGGQRFLLGDSTGHGLAAAIAGMVVFEAFYTMTKKGFSVADIAAEINRKLYQLLPTGRFLAACFLDLSSDHHRLEVWNGGMPDVFIKNAHGAIDRRVSSSKTPLGVVPTEAMDCDPEIVYLQRKDKIYAFSDGVIEAEDQRGRVLGYDGLQRLIAESDDAGNFVHVSRGIQRFIGDVPRRDDISLIEILCDPSLITASPSCGNEERLQRQPLDWNFKLELGASALRAVDPVPLVINLVSELQGLDGERSTLYTILMELYSNALEHGLLDLDSSMKASADGFVTYYSEREKRLAGLDQGNIRISFEQKSGAPSNPLRIAIAQSGAGFDHEANVVELKTNGGFAGRGIGVVSSLCEDLSYADNGRHAEANYLWHEI